MRIQDLSLISPLVTALDAVQDGRMATFGLKLKATNGRSKR
jgi:hypothetical protein